MARGRDMMGGVAEPIRTEKKSSGEKSVDRTEPQAAEQGRDETRGAKKEQEFLILLRREGGHRSPFESSGSAAGSARHSRIRASASQASGFASKTAAKSAKTTAGTSTAPKPISWTTGTEMAQPIAKLAMIRKRCRPTTSGKLTGAGKICRQTAIIAWVMFDVMAPESGPNGG